MADPASEISALRARLRDSRHRLSGGVGSVGDSLDMPSRLRQKVASEPWKWTAVALVSGAVAARLLPAALSVSRKVAGHRLLRTLIATAAPIAARAGLAALTGRFTNGGVAPPPTRREDARADGI